MSKRSSKQHKNQMEIDFESLLMSGESENETPPKKTKSQKKVKYSNPPKSEKPKRTAIEEPEDDDDVYKTVENFKTDFGKPMQAKKVKLEEFTRQVVEIYQGKATALRKKQVSEEKDLRMKFTNEIDNQLEEWKEDMDKVMKKEEEIVQMLQKHLKIMEKAKNSVTDRKKNLMKIAKRFKEQKEELVEKHESEIGVAMEAAKQEISELRAKVIADIQKEEMASVKRLLCSGMLF